MTDEELKALFESLRQETASLRQETTNGFTEVRHEIAETRRHLEVRIEASRDETRLVAEGVVNVAEQLKQTEQRLDEKIDRTAAETQAMLRFSHADLDRRFRNLEETVTDLQERVERLERSPH